MQQECLSGTCKISQDHGLPSLSKIKGFQTQILTYESLNMNGQKKTGKRQLQWLKQQLLQLISQLMQNISACQRHQVYPHAKTFTSWYKLL